MIMDWMVCVCVCVCVFVRVFLYFYAELFHFSFSSPYFSSCSYTYVPSCRYAIMSSWLGMKENRVYSNLAKDQRDVAAANARYRISRQTIFCSATIPQRLSLHCITLIISIISFIIFNLIFTLFFFRP